MTRILLIISTAVGIRYYYDSNNFQVAIAAFMLTFLVLWALVAVLGLMARKGKFFTNLPLNQYLILENMGEQTLKFLGFGVRTVYVRKKDAPELDFNVPDKIDYYEKKIIKVRVNQDTSDIETIDELEPGEYAKSLFAFLLAKYLGIAWIGLPGAVRIKEWDMTFNKIVNGRLVKKTERVRSVFDTYPYGIEIGTPDIAENDYLETGDNFKVYYLLLVNIQVTNIRQMVYGYLPSGHWIDVVGGEIKDIAKIHTGNKGYEDLRKESDMLIYTGDAPLVDVEHMASTSDFSLADKVKMLSHRLRALVGAQIPESSIITFEKAKNMDQDEALAKKEVTILNMEADLEKEKIQLKIEEQKTLQSAQKYQQQMYELAAERDLNKKFVAELVALGQGKPELQAQILDYAKTSEIAKLKNLLALNTGAPLIDLKNGGN